MNLKTVLKEIKPSRKEKKEMNSFVSKILKTSRKISKIIKPMICGSIAKDTWLSKRYELDLFLLFKPSFSKKQIEKKGLEIAKKIVKTLKGKYQIAFAEHPYLRGWIGKFQVDIVPCYSIKDPEKIKSAVDRTPHHVRFAKRNLKKPDDVRLLKQFCIANKCYGADVKTLGFSGYLCELLIIKYGSFEKLVKDASKWRAGKIISFGKIDKNFILKKFKTPLIIIDPVDKNRNVSAAVSVENFYKFVRYCKDFVRNPKREFFFPRKIKPYSIDEIRKEIQKRGTRWYIIKFKKAKVIEDILYPQLRRCLRSIEKELEKNGFKVMNRCSWCNGECTLIFEMETWQVPKISKNIGPNVFSKHAEEFLKHYKENRVYIEKENWVVERERKFTTVLHLLKDLLSKSKRELLEKGIPNKIAPLLDKNELTAGGDVLKTIAKLPEDFRSFLREWFERDLNVI
jgi:tRNA nucleotidyltransferase (CCA-adding enzyme)